MAEAGIQRRDGMLTQGGHDRKRDREGGRNRDRDREAETEGERGVETMVEATTEAEQQLKDIFCT